MRNTLKRRLLGTGAVVAWTIVIIGGIASIWIDDHEQCEWIFFILLTVAAVLTLLWWQARQIPAVMQQPAIEAKHRKPGPNEQLIKELIGVVGTVEACAAAAADGDIPPLPPVPQSVIDACNAPAGSKPREIELEILGYHVTRTITPGDDPERVWRETYKILVDTHLK